MSATLASTGIVGNGRAGVSDGAENELRLGRLGELVNLPGGDAWTELTLRARTFTASNGTAGVAPGTALSTAPPFVLYNPPSSGVIAIVADIEAAFVSGTLGAGNIVLAGIGSQNVTTLGTALTPAQPNLIGSSAVPLCKALQAPTLSAAPTLIRNLWYTGAFVTNATQYLGTSNKDTRGFYGVMPGGALAIQEVGAAGTTPLMMFSMVWAEMPIVFNP